MTQYVSDQLHEVGQGGGSLCRNYSPYAGKHCAPAARSLGSYECRGSFICGFLRTLYNESRRLHVIWTLRSTQIQGRGGRVRGREAGVYRVGRLALSREAGAQRKEAGASRVGRRCRHLGKEKTLAIKISPCYGECVILCCLSIFLLHLR